MTDTAYNPKDANHRRALAGFILDRLEGAGFTEEMRDGITERTFSRKINDTMRVLVYTSIVCKDMRRVGTDAIRVVALYRNVEGQDRGIAKANKRINRTGGMVAISERMVTRMREVWRIACTGERCHCGAPMFQSRAKNLVCADLCWKKAA